MQNLLNSKCLNRPKSGSKYIQGKVDALKKHLQTSTNRVHSLRGLKDLQSADYFVFFLSKDEPDEKVFKKYFDTCVKMKIPMSVINKSGKQLPSWIQQYKRKIYFFECSSEKSFKNMKIEIIFFNGISHCTTTK